MTISDQTATSDVRGRSSFEVLAPERCLELLSCTTVGRVAFLGSNGLALLPVNYRVIDDLILLRVSATGTLAELAHVGDEVVFEVDYHAPTARTGWSVIVRGTCSVVTDDRRLDSAALARLVPWASGDQTLVLSLDPHRITGRNVGQDDGSTRGPGAP